MTAATATSPPSRLQLGLAFLSLYVIWGSTYLAMALAIETLPVFLMAATRHLVAGVILFAWARRRTTERIEPVHWRSAAIVGVALLAIGNGLVAWSETLLPSGLAAVLIATVPLWMVLIEALRRGGTYPTALEAVGVALGFGGVALLVGRDGLAGHGAVHPMGALALIIAALSWASGSLYSRGAPLPKSPMLATSLEMLCGGAALVVVSLALGEPQGFDLAAVSLRSLLGLGFLVFFGSLIGFTAYIWLLGVAKPAQVATYAYVNPVVAVLLGWLFHGEPVTARTFLAAGVIIAGVAVITLSRGRSKPLPAAPQPALVETEGSISRDAVVEST
jgi:drug/metabolite transporter (DMT)-like permease